MLSNVQCRASFRPALAVQTNTTMAMAGTSSSGASCCAEAAMDNDEEWWHRCLISCLLHQWASNSLGPWGCGPPISTTKRCSATRMGTEKAQVWSGMERGATNGGNNREGGMEQWPGVDGERGRDGRKGLLVGRDGGATWLEGGA